MRILDLRAAVAAAGVLTLIACSEKKPAPAPAYPTAPAPSADAPTRPEPPAPAAPAAPMVAAAPAPTPAAPTATPSPAAPPAAAEARRAASAAKPAATGASSTATPPSAAAAPAAKPTPAPAGTQPAAPVARPAPAEAPPATPATAGHAKVGATKCKMCHRVQYESWAASSHAKKDLDCEGCHGHGGDYWNASVMRDRAKATAAGLVIPTLASCKRCHPDVDAARFARVHAHKGS